MLFTNKEKSNFAKDPAVVKFNGTYYLYYSIMLSGNKFSIGIAVSKDMEQWQLWQEPGVFPMGAG